jgi:dolichyl-phosphate beta-glucosyltransferase
VTPDTGKPTSAGGATCELSVVLPAYNEARVIETRLELLRQHLHERERSWEIIVVDDGSRDETSEKVAAAARSEPSLRLVKLPANRGKGAAVARGMEAARGSVVAVTDADLSYALADLDAATFAVRNGADVATGNRDHPDSRINLPFRMFPYLVRRWVAGRLFKTLVRILFRLDFPDTQCGLKAFSRRAVETLPPRLRTPRYLADIEMLLAARRLGLEVVQIPVHLRYLSAGSSVRLLADLPGALADLVRIKAADLRGRYGRAGE